MTEKILESERVFTGRVFSISVDQVVLDDGRTAPRERVHHSGGVCAVALTDSGEVPLVRQFRYGMGLELLEVPAGKLEKGESPEECGRRELSEECGFIAESFTSLGVLYPTPAYCSEVIHMFLARGLTKVEAHLDDGEFLTVEFLPFDVLRKMCLNGEINDAKTVTAVLRAAELIK